MSALENSEIRVAIVTGSAQGIGRAIALRLAADGLDIAVNDIPSKIDSLNGVAAEIRQLGRKVAVLTFDVTHEESVQSMISETVRELGRLDVMVANAGITDVTRPTLLTSSMEQWERVFDVNLRGTLYCYKYAAQQMVRQRSQGRIIGASSICGLRGFANAGAYCMSKAGVRSLTQTVALELREYGITVNAYAPGFIQTAMSTSEKDEEPCSEGKKHLRVPDAPVGQPDDVAGLVSYFVSPAAQAITGQTVSVSSDGIFH